MDKWNVLKTILGIFLIFYIVLYVVEPGKLLEELTKINLFYLIIAILFYFGLDLLWSVRLYLSMKWLGYKLSFKESFWSHLLAMLWSNITPGRTGYIGVIYSLKKKTKLPLSEGLGLTGLVSSTDFLMKAIGAFLAIIFIITFLGGGEVVFWGAISVIFIVFLSLGFLLVLWKDSDFLEKLIKKIPFVGEKLNKTINDMKKPFKKMSHQFPNLMGIAFGLWVIRGIEWFFIGKACNIELPFMVFFLLHPLLTTIRLIPITPAGLGMFEGVVILGFSLFGVPAENALLLSFLDRIDNIFVDLLALKELKNL